MILMFFDAWMVSRVALQGGSLRNYAALHCTVYE